MQAERTPGHDPQVPLHKTDGARVQVRDPTLHPSHLQPRGGIQHAARHSIGALRLLPATPCGPSRASDALEEATARNISGAVGKQTAGSHSLEGKGSTQGDDRSAAQQRTNAGPRPVLQPLQLYLSNPHNLCYSNAVFIGLHWVGRSLSTSTNHEPSVALGRLQPLLAMLHRGAQHRPIYTPNLLGFQLIFQNFPGFREQHDACEFLHHCLQYAQAEEGLHKWEARLSTPQQVEVLDSGTLRQPIQLHLNGHNLQELVDDWQHQRRMHGLVQPTSVCTCKFAGTTHRVGPRVCILFLCCQVPES